MRTYEITSKDFKNWTFVNSSPTYKTSKNNLCILSVQSVVPVGDLGKYPPCKFISDASPLQIKTVKELKPRIREECIG